MLSGMMFVVTVLGILLAIVVGGNVHVVDWCCIHVVVVVVLDIVNVCGRPLCCYSLGSH